MFCDDYNPINKTYCKRLRVLCPEHSRDPKVGDQEVCGCPLVVNVFTATGKFCRAPKKSCTRHFVWEKMRRAEVRSCNLYYYAKEVITSDNAFFTLSLNDCRLTLNGCANG